MGGNKYRTLSQTLPLFPNNIDTFVDLFCGEGKKHTILACWARNYNVVPIDVDYSNSNYTIKNKTKSLEVLITNYELPNKQVTTYRNNWLPDITIS